MAKIELNQLNDVDQYWSPTFDELTHRFEAGLVDNELGCWGDIADGWAFDNEQECADYCKKLNDAIGSVAGGERTAGFDAGNFELLKSRDSGFGYTVNVYAPKEGMCSVPEDLIDHYLGTEYDYYDIVRDPEGVRWTGGNHDVGSYDALVAKHFTRTKVDIYVCAILRRPFTKEESDKYDTFFSKDLHFRLTHIYDNHVKNDFTIFK